MAALQDEQVEGNIVGINLDTGEPMDPVAQGVFDSFRVLRNSIASASSIASNLLLCDELLKARQMVCCVIFQILGTSHLLSGSFLIARVRKLVLAGPPKSSEFRLRITKTGYSRCRRLAMERPLFCRDSMVPDTCKG